MGCPQCGFALPTDAVKCPTCGLGADAHLRPPAGAPPRPVHGRAVAVVAALALWSVVELFAGVIGAIRFSLIGRTAAGEPSSAGDARSLDDLYDLSSDLRLGVLAVAAAVYIVWLFRARANAEGLSWVQHRHGRPWLVVAWVVPIANLFVPRRIIDDIWLSSRPGPPPDGRRAERPSWLVFLWWTAYLVYFFGIRATENTLERMLEEDALPWLARLEVARPLAGVAAAVLAALVVWRISGFQELRRTAGVAADVPGGERSGALDAS
ncbi:DUF4328 domain-containing protein [Sphaerisporangium dianthi]|uniref:DUF4328 domain-containing protein n=1 Tax=Sphaerisporangium dianthi TaxID=1436120 RepID=A0ABV9CFG6_9ACTN